MFICSMNRASFGNLFLFAAYNDTILIAITETTKTNKYTKNIHFSSCVLGNLFIYECPGDLVFRPEIGNCDYANNVKGCEDQDGIGKCGDQDEICMYRSQDWVGMCRT